MKTKLGVSAGFVAAFAYALAMRATGDFLTLAGLALLAGYVYLREQNDWLKFSVTKAIVLVIAYIVVTGLLAILPDFVLSIQSNILGTFGISGGWTKYVTFIFDLAKSWFGIIYKVILLILVVGSFKMKSMGVGPVDTIAKNAMGGNNQ